MQLQGKPNRVTQWAKSTQNKVTTFLDDYLINYPVKSVRQSTRNLLNSLFKKGTPLQRQNMLDLITDRIDRISSMGNSSAEFLTLIFHILQGQVDNKPNLKKQVLNKILDKGQEILKHAIASQKYDFYSYLSNTIEFSTSLQPYLIEASGCLKCYGKTQFVFQQKDCKQIARQIKAHISQIQLIFNRTYAVKDLKINLGKKKLMYKTVSIFYIDQKGEKKQLGGKYSVQQNLPALEFNGSALLFDFEFQKSKRHITCHVCGNSNSPQEYCFICSVCFQKFVQIDGSFKVIGAEPEKLSLELCGKYSELDARKVELEQMYNDIKNNRKTQFPNYSLIKDMENIYGQIMKNLQLFKKDDSKKSSLKLQECKDCFSCNINEIEFIVDFLKQNFEYSEQSSVQVPQYFTSQQISSLLSRLIEISSMNKLNKLQKKITSILANLILFKNSSRINYFEQLKELSHSPKIVADLLFEVVRIVKQKESKLKEGEQSPFDWNQLAQYLNQTKFVSSWNEQEKIRLFSAYFIKAEMHEVMGLSIVQKEALTDITRLDARQYKRLQNLINFPIQSILKQPITTYTKLFLSLIPQSLIPSYNIDVSDSQYLKYIKTTAPQISDSLIFSNIVFCPNPIIKLNLFPTLPDLITYLPLQESMKLITSLVKYKELWNLNLKQTLNRFEEQLNKEENEKKLILSLQGYSISKENIYLDKIYQILVPQRMSFIIRMEVPQADMQKEERLREGGPIEYIFLPVREVKTENLNGDTMRSLHEWVTEQLKKMNQDLPFDLIVDKYIIDNLDLPIEVVYKKIAQKQVKKKIGSQSYDFIKVIYRMQGFFGDANESASSNPRDQNLEACLNYSSYLLTKIPQIQKTGLDVIMSILASFRKSQSKHNRQKIFRILQIISMNPAIIKKIIEWQYADLIINSTIKFFSLQQDSIKFSQVLLDICSKIIKQANEEMINLRKKSFTNGFGMRKQSDLIMDLQGNIQQIQSESQKTVKFLLQKVKQCEQKGRKDLCQKMITLIPFCSKDESSSSKYLFEYFELPNMHLAQLKSSRKLPWFLQFIEIISQSYTSFKSFCRQNNFTSQVIANILLNIEQLKNLQDKKAIKNLDVLELSLAIIKGLVRGDEILQKQLFDQGLVQQLYRIAKMSEGQLQKKGIKVGKVLTISYEFVKYFKEGHIVHPEIADFIKGSDADKIKKNQEKKKSKLLAMKQKNNFIAQKYEQELMINEEQENFVCSSCREGYNKRNQVIGIYIYSFKQQTLAIEGWWKENKRQAGLTSVSYFTPIHFQCHVKAFQSDQKILKSQWQGALIRNSDVKCNGWIAVKGPKTNDDQFDRVNKKYFDKNSKTNGYWVVMNDLNGLLQKFSTQYNFSQETKGSSSTHNCKLILILMASTCHYMKKIGEDLKLLDQGVKYIEQHMTKRGHLLNLFFCVTMFTNQYSVYQQKKEKYLKLIDHLELADFKQKKKFYIYLALVNQIYCLIHVTLKDKQRILEYLDKFIPQNFGTLVTAFEKIAQKYKNVFTKWDNEAQTKEYFSVAH